MNPKLKRNIKRILPISGIFLFTGWVFLFIEQAATLSQNLDPDSAITLTFPVFIFASIAVAIVGLMVGTIEMVYLERKFSNYSFLKKILFKLLIYLLFFFVIMSISFPIAASIELSESILSINVWKKFITFLTSLTLLSTMVQLFFSLLLSLIYAAVSENIGLQVLINFFIGRYHKPRAEERIFMFLDMKSSTAIAEKLGHEAYFELLKMYYDCMSDPIILNGGEVYQYIGDEVVVSWKIKDKKENSKSVLCFFDIKASMQDKMDEFNSRFGIAPDFKAGLHVGQVNIGEVGALKKEIVFSGDVLNTTSRIQGLCNQYKADLLISENLLNLIEMTGDFNASSIGEVSLKGREKTIKIFKVEQ